MGRKSKEELALIEEEKATEFNKAVADAVAAKMPEVMKEAQEKMLALMAFARETHGTGGVTDGDKGYMQGLALEIAKVNGQGVGKMPITPPEVLEQRAIHREKMINLLIDVRARGVQPGYRVMKTMYLNDGRIEPEWMNPATKQMQDTEIDWDKIPNRWMKPLDDDARAIHREYLGFIGEMPAADPADAPMVRSNDRLVRGKTPEQRALMNPQSAPADPRRVGHGAPGVAKHEHILGTIAPPAVVG